MHSRSTEISAGLACNDNAPDRMIDLRRSNSGKGLPRPGILGVIAGLGCDVCADYIAPGVLRIGRS
jgi:hypothetical protein